MGTALGRGRGLLSHSIGGFVVVATRVGRAGGGPPRGAGPASRGPAAIPGWETGPMVSRCGLWRRLPRGRREEGGLGEGGPRRGRRERGGEGRAGEGEGRAGRRHRAGFSCPRSPGESRERRRRQRETRGDTNPSSPPALRPPRVSPARPRHAADVGKVSGVPAAPARGWRRVSGGRAVPPGQPGGRGGAWAGS